MARPVVAMLLAFLALGWVPAVLVSASEVEPIIQDREEYVFTVGYVERVSRSAVTLRFDDGKTDTYAVNRATSVQTQNGDALGLADVKVGDLVLLIAGADDATAVTIVDNGEAGFHDAGPADLLGHQDGPCAACDARSP